jgi:alkylation response protein AidB-like acyl-CoA dehydrogenase
VEFKFTEEQEMTRNMVRDFAENEIAPHVSEWDKKHEFPHDIVKKLGELGLLGIVFPPEYGGAGLSYIDYVIILEELSRIDPSIGLTVAAHVSLCSNHIYIAGTEEQKKKYLTPLASGKKIGAWGLTEPGAGSDAAGTKTTAIIKGDEWILNGTKQFITNGSVGDIAIIMASTTKEKRAKGISAFIVEKDTPGFRPGKKEDKMGLRATDTSELILEDCHIPKENLLGELDRGFIDALRILDGGRISIAAFSLGTAQGAYEAALNYSKEREQFDQLICEFQAIQWMLADMATEIEAARLLTFKAAYLADQKKRVTKESAMAKLYASEVAVRAAEKCVQIHGGYGFITDYPAEKFYRDAKLATIGEGTSEIQRFIIARNILK